MKNFLKNEEENLPYLNRKKKTADEIKIQQKKDLQKSIRENPILKKTFGEYLQLPKYLSQIKQTKVECGKFIVVFNFLQNNCSNFSVTFNKTAEDIRINSVQDKEPLKMKQFFKPNLGKTLYETSNEFEIKTLSGFLLEIIYF